MYIYKYQTRHFHFHKFMERISYACLLQLPYVHVRVYCQVEKTSSRLNQEK